MKRWVNVIVGCAIIGFLGAVLVAEGNPGNMGICGVCFTRDTAGALGFHSARAVQYIRPELIGLILGAFLTAFASKEFNGRAGSAPLVRFTLGILMSIGALVFLGCPTRMLMRLGGGDLNALTGLAGFVTGVLLSLPLYRFGYTLGKSEPSGTAHGLVVPLLALILLALAIFHPVLNPAAGGPVFASTEGPGSKHAPLWFSLAAGAIAGAALQRSRFCVVGAVRDIPLGGGVLMAAGTVVMVVVLAAANAGWGLFQWGFDKQPVAHTDHLWNFLGMTLTGLAAAMAGGCPVRQMILCGEGNGGAGVTFLGLFAGAAFAHNFNLASGPGGVSPYGPWAIAGGLVVCGVIALSFRSSS